MTKPLRQFTSIGFVALFFAACKGPIGFPVGGIVTGQVLDAQGRPASGVEIRVYGTSAVTDGQGREVIPPPPQSRRHTDAEGRFTASIAGDVGRVTVEAIQSDAVKGIAFNVLGGPNPDPITLRLGPTGPIIGHLTAPGAPSGTQLQGTRVFLQHTGYATESAQDGSFTLPNVAAGSFRLVADQLAVGHAELENVEVGGQVRDVGEVALRMQAPVVRLLTHKHGGPGVEFRVFGDHFTPRADEALRVRFGDTVATNVKLIRDNTIDVTVPPGARTGPFSVEVGDRSSGRDSGPRFQVVKRIVVRHVDDLYVGADFNVSTHLEDTEGQPIPTPHILTWRTEGNAVVVREDVRPFLVVSPGLTWLVAQSGMIVGKTFADVEAQPPQPIILAGDGTPALQNGRIDESRFHYPSGIAVDAAGTLYVAERGNHTIRLVSSDGVVRVLAGAGVPGFADGHMVEARFNQPQGLAWGPDGALYVADTENHRIRRVSLEGAVTTFAGRGEPGWADGARAIARFQAPTGLAFDRAGNLYVADSGNHRIRRISPDDIVETIAGDGLAGDQNGPGATARFRNPMDVAVIGDDVVLVADTENHRIRMIAPNGEVSTFAGTGRPGLNDGLLPAVEFNRPRGLLVDGQNVFIADSGNHSIRKLVPGGVRTYAGTGQAGISTHDRHSLFANPHGLAMDRQGQIYVADEDSHRLRKFIR